MWALRKGWGTFLVTNGNGLTLSGIKAGPHLDINVSDSERMTYTNMLFNTLHCVACQILRDVMRLNTGAGGLALVLVSISVTVGV